MASEEITNETAEQPVEAATPAPVAETPAAAVSAHELEPTQYHQAQRARGVAQISRQMLAIERLFELRSWNCEQAFVVWVGRCGPRTRPDELTRPSRSGQSEIVTPPSYCLNHLPTTTV